MDQGYARRRYSYLLICTLIVLLALPGLIVAAGVIEERYFDTMYVFKACDAIGIAKPLEKFFRWLL